MHSGSFNCHQALQNTAESTSKNHSSKSCRFTILPPEVSAAACELRVVWTVSLSSPLTLAFASSDWWPAKVIYLSLSSYIPSVPPYTRTYVHFHKKTHCTHWCTVDCRRVTIYMRPPGCPLFVCLHLWLRSGSARSPLSRLVHRATLKIRLYVRLYLELSCKNKNQILALLIQGLRGIKCMTLKLTAQLVHHGERCLCLLHSYFWKYLTENH